MRKYSLMLISAATIVLLVLGGAQYYMTRQGIRRDLMRKADRDIKESKRVEAVKAEVETAVRNKLGSVEMSIHVPDRFYALTAQLVKNNPHIVGAGVAFRPDYYKTLGKDRLYAPYAYDEQPVAKMKNKQAAKQQIRTSLLPFDYTQREWFIKPLQDDKSLWTNPYLDQGGTRIIMCTYVMAVHDKTGETVGVIFADVPMEDVSLLSMDMNKGVSKSLLVTIIIQIISILFIGLIIWSAVRASRRYKETYVDPEKEYLAEQVQKLKQVNTRLTMRIQELAGKYQELDEKNKQLEQRLQASGQGNQHWFG